MSRLLSPLLLAALCWVSGHHCLENENCIFALDLSKTCMQNIVDRFKHNLTYWIEPGFPVLYGQSDDLEFNITYVQLLRVNRISVHRMSMEQKGIKILPPSQPVWETVRMNLELKWWNIELVITFTLKCLKNQCEKPVHAYAAVSFNLANIAFSCDWSILDAGAHNRNLSLDSVSNGLFQLDVVSSAFGNNVRFHEYYGNLTLPVLLELETIVQNFWKVNQKKIKNQVRWNVREWLIHYVLRALVDDFARSNANGIF